MVHYVHRTKFTLVFLLVGVSELNPASCLLVACSIPFVVCDGMWFCVWCPIVAFYFACSYGMRYIAKVLKNSLHEKFPDSSEDELMKVERLECLLLWLYICTLVPITALLYCNSAHGVPHKNQIMNSCHCLLDCRKPSVLPLHESSHRGSWRLRHHWNVSWRAATAGPAS